MPNNRLPQHLSPVMYLVAWCPALLLTSGASAAERPVPVGSRDVELHYRVDASKVANVELWYTRDRGATWVRYDPGENHKSPIVFTTPAEGLYGFLLRAAEVGSNFKPAPFQRPDRWVFVDYTPPLAQWDGAEFVDRPERLLHLRWTAHDDHFSSRPITLAYRAEGQQNWRIFEPALPNTGRYDWPIPAEVSGLISIRLTVRDQGEHVVERIIGPLELAPAAVASTKPAEAEPEKAIPASQPVTATRPAGEHPADRTRSEELYRQGSWHLVRGQYALAAERFREALELDPDALPAANDLAGIYYLQKDYTKAAELYNRVLARDQRHASALRGLALVHVAQKQYGLSRDALTRLLATNQKDSEAWLDLGDVLFMMGRQVDARRHWEQAARVDPAARAIIEKARRRLDLYGGNAAPPAGISGR